MVGTVWGDVCIIITIIMMMMMMMMMTKMKMVGYLIDYISQPLI